MNFVRKILNIKKGFTLVELLLVMFVVSALAVGYIKMQQKMIDWKNKLQFESHSELLKSLFKAYYINSLDTNRTSGSVWPMNGLIDVIPVCAGGSTYNKTNGTLYVCAVAGNSGSKNINYMSTANLASQILNSLSAYGAGSNILNPYDPWKRPIIFLIFRPRTNNYSYCPIVDRNSAKVIIFSLGPDGRLNTPSGQNPITFLSQAIDANGRFNSSWSPLGDDIAITFSTEEIDLDRRKLIISQLVSIGNTLKNRFFEDFYRMLSAQLATVDATKINYFNKMYCSSSCSLQLYSSRDALRNAFGYSDSELKDYFGNYICFDSDINRSLASESCQNYSGVGCYPSQNSAGSFVARVYTPCALNASNRVSCNSNTGDLWPGSVSIIDPSYVLSIGGMY